MKISFFEEFPVKKNLDKLKLVNWKCNLFIGCDSLKKFQGVSDYITRKFPSVKLIYWPILSQRDGYWISPFSSTTALTGLFNSLKGYKIPVMLDMELPITTNKFLFITQSFNFFRNNKLINNFINTYDGEIYTAEYLFEPFFLKFMYKNLNNKRIKMIYSSMFDLGKERINLKLKYYTKMKFLIGLGTIAPGVNGNEPVLGQDILERDLELCRRNGIKEVVIFRLGGINKSYLTVINKFLP